MSAVGVGIGGLVAVRSAAWGEFARPLLWAGAAAAAFTAGGNALNDVYDRETDRVNHPERPLPAGEVNVAAAKSFVVSAFTIAASLAVFASVWAFAIVLGVLSLGYAILVVPADGMFIYAALHSAANPARSQRVTKYGMIVALAAFLAGAFV